MPEMGLLSLFTPRRLVRRVLGELAAEILTSGQQRVQSLLAIRGEQAVSLAAAQTLLEVYQTATGLEVWLGGQRYVIPAAE